MEETNRKVKTFTFHDSVNESHEWYTPRPLIEKLGVEFDLDPASSTAANTLIQAKNIFTKEDDGLKQDWYGNVWLNPPYGKDVPIWLEKAIYEITMLIQKLYLQQLILLAHRYIVMRLRGKYGT